MCGIVGYVSSRPSRRAVDVALGGLSHLEYRGYDSAGVALATEDHRIEVVKRVGKLANLRAALDEDASLAPLASIGHTRWATHGPATEVNSHPHVADDGALALVHNGIIENAATLRGELATLGIHCVSDTDTEVVAHLIALINRQIEGGHLVVTPDDTIVNSGVLTDLDDDTALAAVRLACAVREATTRLDGTFTLLVMHADAPGVIVAARRSSPLVIGRGEGENFLGSDVLAFSDSTDRAFEVGQDHLVVATARDLIVIDPGGDVVEPKPLPVEVSSQRASKDGWPTFMEKEIHEQPDAIAATLADRLDASGALTIDELRIPEEVLRRVDKMVIVGCGTAAYAGQVARYAIEHWCRIPVEVELAHEFRYRDPVVTEKTLVVAISQSGETMDTIMAIRHAREQGAKVVAIVNTPGSTISRESDAVLLTHAGREVAVASTKAFTAQITATYILGLYLAQVRGNKFADEVQDYLDKLGRVPDLVREVLSRAETVRMTARALANEESVIFLGRHVGCPVAMEGALKLKEIAYIHAEGFAAGELKHGPIALIDRGQVVVIVVPTPRRPELHRKVVSNIEEVRARGAYTIVIAEDGDDAVVDTADVIVRIPQVPTLYAPLLTVVPLQVFACELASAKGYDVDQPRNLAKSVTVE